MIASYSKGREGGLFPRAAFPFIFLKILLALCQALWYNPICALYPRYAGLRAAYYEVNKMKQGIHPNYQRTTIRCACGEVIETGSTKKDITVEICSKCHPFYTGKQKLVDTSGRVDKFNKKYGLK